MKALTWKEVFASMNPSPVFEALAMLAEDSAIKGDESYQHEVLELPCRSRSCPGLEPWCAGALSTLRHRFLIKL